MSRGFCLGGFCPDAPESGESFDQMKGMLNVIEIEGILRCEDRLGNQSSDILQHSQNRPTGDRWL